MNRRTGNAIASAICIVIALAWPIRLLFSGDFTPPDDVVVFNEDDYKSGAKSFLWIVGIFLVALGLVFGWRAYSAKGSDESE